MANAHRLSWGCKKAGLTHKAAPPSHSCPACKGVCLCGGKGAGLRGAAAPLGCGQRQPCRKGDPQEDSDL